MPAETPDAANRFVGADSIIGEPVAADATVWDSNEGPVVGNGASWEEEAVAGNGAFWEVGAQPINPANNATRASNLPKLEPCDMGLAPTQ